MSEYSVFQERKQAFEHIHQGLSTKERLDKVIEVFDELLETGSTKSKIFALTLITNILFKLDENGGWLDSAFRDINLAEQFATITERATKKEEHDEE